MAHSTERDAIRNLQRYLRQLSYTDTDIPSPAVDGIFDTATRDSLLAFQRKYALEPSGVGDRATWNRLYSEYLSSLATYVQPRPLYIFPRVPDGYTVSSGDEYFLVSIIQLLLNELRIIYDTLEPLTVSGKYDEATVANVKKFQSKNQLKATGNVDKATWDKMSEAYQNYASDYVK